MLRLAKKNVTPPGGFRYVDADTKQKFDAPSIDTLLAKIRTHRSSNNLDVPENLKEIIEHWICEHIPAGLCVDERGAPTRSGIYNAESSIKATMLIYQLSKNAKHSKTPNNVANARAAICAKCPANVPFAGCMSCRGVKSIIDNLKRGRRTAHDEHLQSCAICGVLNQIHVFIDEQTIEKTAGQISRYPDNCWKHELIEGATNERDNIVARKDDARRPDTRNREYVLRKERAARRNKQVRSRAKPCRSCGGSRKRKRAKVS